MENQNLEFKQAWHDETLKTACAFANTAGGIIYIGVDDKGRSVALHNPGKLLEDIPNKIRDILGIVADVRIIKKRGKPVIKITIKKYIAPISYKGAFYIRSGSTSSELKGMELSRFLIAHAGTTWDNIVEPKAVFSDISVKAVRHFQQLAKMRFPFIASEKNIKLVLQKLNLMENNKLKRAAILLFGNNPRKYFISAFIQVGRFVSESEVVSTDIIEGNLFEQVEKTIEILRVKYLENRFYYEGIYRKEDLIYPEDALREAVINAVIHRDYLGPHTQLRVYNNKLWLWNIGKLSKEITFDKLKKPHSSYPRNELLADVFFKAGFIEAWGRGTLKIIDKCREKKLPEPEFSEMTGGFLISFFKPKDAEKAVERFGENKEKIRRKSGEADGKRLAGRLADGLVDKVTDKVTKKVTDKVTKNQGMIISAMKKDPYITVRKLADMVGISERKIKENIKKIKRKKRIKRIGSARAGYWRVYGQD
jgi:ATP-dependent DNA helicase RecG